MIEAVKNEINTITLQTLDKYLEKNSTLCLTYYLKNNNNTSIPEYTIKNKLHVLSGDIIVESLSTNHRNNFSLFHKKLGWCEQNIANACQLIINKEIQTDFYFYWYSQFPIEILSNFYQVSGKIIPVQDSLCFLIDMNLKDIFIKQFTHIKSPFISIPSKIAFENMLDLLDRIEPTQQISTLLKFCTQNKILFKRIESQNVLQNFLISHSYQQNEFKIFIKDLIKNEHKPIFNIVPSVVFYINKKNAYSKYYNSMLKDKYTLTITLEEIVTWLNREKNSTLFNINTAFLENKIEMFEDYVIVISFKEQTDPIEIINIIDELIYHTTHSAIHPREFSNNFSKIYQNYRLNKSIEQKDQKPMTKKI